MASDLEKLANAVRELANQASTPMRVLDAIHQQIVRLNSRAAALGGPEGERIEEQLASALRGTEQAAEAMYGFREGAGAFAERLVGGGMAKSGNGELGPRHPGEANPEFKVSAGAELPPAYEPPTDLRMSEALGIVAVGAVASELPPADEPTDPRTSVALGRVALGAVGMATFEKQATPSELDQDSVREDEELANEWGLAQPAGSIRLSAEDDQVPPGTNPGRYLQPKPEHTQALQDALALYGTQDVAGWIGKINPDYSTGLVSFKNNCGSTARSFANTLQGVDNRPALGDTRRPASEDAEMYRALRIAHAPMHRKRGYPYRSIDPDPHGNAFTATAFDKVALAMAGRPAGSVAIIGVMYGDGYSNHGGHWLNAYVDSSGDLKWADAQNGTQGYWPPPTGPICEIEMAVRDTGAAPWNGVDLL